MKLLTTIFVVITLSYNCSLYAVTPNPEIAGPNPRIAGPNREIAGPKSEASADIQINGHYLVIPLQHGNHWVRISTQSNGKTGHVVVQSQVGKHGKIVTRHFDINNKHPKHSYHFVEYSSTDKLDSRQIKQLLASLQRQQQAMDRFFAQQQAEMQRQLVAMNRKMTQWQREFFQTKRPDEHLLDQSQPAVTNATP